MLLGEERAYEPHLSFQVACNGDFSFGWCQAAICVHVSIKYEIANKDAPFTIAPTPQTTTNSTTFFPKDVVKPCSNHAP